MLKKVLTLTALGLLLGGQLFPSEPQTESPSKALTQQVSQEFQRHNYKKVITLVHSFSSEYPDRLIPLTVRIYLSESLADTGEIDDAIKVLKEVLGDISQIDSLILQYDLANLLFMQKRYGEARTAFQKILFQAAGHQQILAKVHERMSAMKEGEGKRKDVLGLQLLEIETAVDMGEVPDGAVDRVREIEQENPIYTDQAKLLLDKIREVRIAKSNALLGEARRLFDEEKKYNEVRQILDQIVRDYSDVCEMPSVEALSKAVDKKL